MKKRIALAQMCSGIDPATNAAVLADMIAQAAGKNAEILFTPEMTGMVDQNRIRAQSTICSEQNDQVLETAKENAAKHNIWLHLGSLAVRETEDEDGKWCNRSFLIDPSGKVVAKYDKIHLFDVDLESGETWKESSVYVAGDRAVLAKWEDFGLGMSICYDLRFSSLYAQLADAGADLIAIPAAFTVSTGRAHWETLLKARAIESACFVVAATQCGQHEDGRETYGHSMVIDPWGEILLDMNMQIGLATCDIDFDRVTEVRRNIPVLANRREFKMPDIGKD